MLLEGDDELSTLHEYVGNESRRHASNLTSSTPSHIGTHVLEWHPDISEHKSNGNNVAM
ncbi:hypothetical protein PILCRDRAFT_822557 [Piloderma croceum F 1598]|uniref:Uncharacterized protein n=1 Tax=Piloderma croceum (strain F 1598) TaxID=765440 RepID=A0A0C3FLM8_PILCF|nr:hypothetical protein PILCRDRAFT_822557 [Piloderma croceum F 1598]